MVLLLVQENMEDSAFREAKSRQNIIVMKKYEHTKVLDLAKTIHEI